MLNQDHVITSGLVFPVSASIWLRSNPSFIKSPKTFYFASSTFFYSYF